MSLLPIANGIWCVNGRFRTPFFTGSVRMSAVAGDGGTVLYSPVALAPADVAALEALGPVAAIVAPNLVHHLYLRAAAEAFPAARVFVPAGLEAKIGPVPRAETMTRERPPVLPGGIDHFIFERHAIRETMLFHRPTRTLVTADLLYNYQPEHGAGEKAFFRLIGNYGAPKVAFYHRFALRGKDAVAELVAQVRQWAPRRIVMGHGRIIEDGDAAGIFAAAWRRFG
ncbi:MAG TPA: hypothetical protein VEB68_08245 [Croceibacterium sp.]|nr:hypothetical protein [Croceibacterium sp.]